MTPDGPQTGLPSNPARHTQIESVLPAKLFKFIELVFRERMGLPEVSRLSGR